MPRGDRTGPAGMGPMTGRAAGYCAGYPVPGYMNPVGGRGYWGRGPGGGRGRRNWFYATGLPGWARTAYGWPAWGGYAPPNYGPVAPSVTVLTALDHFSAVSGTLIKWLLVRHWLRGLPCPSDMPW